MRPAPFAYLRVNSVSAAHQALAACGEDTKLIAGGLSLVQMLNSRKIRPRLVIDISRIEDLNHIRPHDGGLMIGATTRQRSVEHSSIVQTQCPLLHAAIKHVGYARIRNQGTIGGSLALADPLGELPAVALAAGARLHISGPAGARIVDADAFFRAGMTTCMARDELLLAVEFPAWPGRTASAFREFNNNGSGYAIVGVAAMLALDETGLVRRLGLGLMGVAAGPFNAGPIAAPWLLGRTPDEAALQQAADAVAAATDPASDLLGPAAYRRHLARTLTLQTLKDAAGRLAAQTH
jgi:carbon-monoxide dehydrogenase medium subunit